MIPSSRQVRLFIRLTKPAYLLGSVLLFGVGVSIAHYLGRPFYSKCFWLGQAMIIAIQLMAHYLKEYYDPLWNVELERRTPSTSTGALGPEGLPRRTALYATTICLAIIGTSGSALLLGGQVSTVSWLILLLMLLGSFFYSSPPLSLFSSGYGEVTTAIIAGVLIPFFAFSLQTGDLHRLLPMSCIPLAAFILAMQIAFSLPTYATDIKFEKKTLIVRLGWSTAMRLHNLAIVFALFSLALAYACGLPRRVAFGTLLILPLAIGQIWQMVRIRRGYPPSYRMLTYGAIGTFALTAYLELVGYLFI